MNFCLDSGNHFSKKFDYNALESYHRFGNAISLFSVNAKSPEASNPEGNMKQYHFQEPGVTKILDE